MIGGNFKMGRTGCVMSFQDDFQIPSWQDAGSLAVADLGRESLEDWRDEDVCKAYYALKAINENPSLTIALLECYHGEGIYGLTEDKLCSMICPDDLKAMHKLGFDKTIDLDLVNYICKYCMESSGLYKPAFEGALRSGGVEPSVDNDKMVWC